MQLSGKEWRCILEVGLIIQCLHHIRKMFSNGFAQIAIISSIISVLLWLFPFPFFFFLKDYRITHPNVTVLDPPDAIQHVYSRQSMLQVVAELNLSDPYGNLLCCISFLSWLKIHTSLMHVRPFVVQEQWVYPNSWLSRKIHHLFLILWIWLGWGCRWVC